MNAATPAGSVTDATADTDHLAELDQRLGDPSEPTNPVGHHAVLAADERAEMLAEGEAVLDDYGLNAHFVPVELGGRLTTMDGLVEVMRTVYRRDPNLGLGYGAASFISSVNVWASGTATQKQAMADLLLRNGKVAATYHELPHGNDMAGMQMRATETTGGWVLNGRKEVVTNLQRADALVVFTRTAEGTGSRNHSQLYIDKSTLPENAIEYLPRYATVGLRGVQLGGAAFHDCSVGADTVVGRAGQGLETAMRSFQVTRTTLPGMMTGILDSALQVTVDTTVGRRLYGGSVADLPHVRSVVAGAFTDLLVCEAFSLVAARALHLLPGQTSLYSSAVKYAVAGGLLRATDRLSGVMGAEFYRRDGDHAVMQKLVRDLKPVGFGHAARAACLTTILPQLGIHARRPVETESLPAGLFTTHADLPSVRFEELSISSRGRDPIGSSLAEFKDLLAGEGHEVVRAQVEMLGTELAELREALAQLPPPELTFTAEARSYDLVERYVNVLASVSCLWIWWHHRDDGDFLGDPLWLLAALPRLRIGLGQPSRGADDPAVQQQMFEEVRRRYADRTSFGLLARPLCGPGPGATTQDHR